MEAASDSLSLNTLCPMNDVREILPRTCRVIEDGIEKKLHLGAQVYVSLDAEPIADFALGENAPFWPLTSDILTQWMSAGKPLTAAAAMRFVEQGELQLDAPVADVIPEFAEHGKDLISLRSLLTHTAGLKPIASGWPQDSWEDIIARICRSGLKRDRGPGTHIGYDPSRSWFILGEMLRRVDGRDVQWIVREDLLEPLGMMDSWMSLPSHLFDAYGKRIGITYSVVDGAPTPTTSHHKEACTSPSPGGSMRGPIRELGLFYEMLLRGGTTANGTRLLQPETVEQMTTRQRQGQFDVSFQHVVDFGLGLIINSARYGVETVPYGFGRHASDNAFGHGGAQSSIGFADPQHGLVVAAVANGCPGEELHNERFRELNSAIYEDLGLAD